MANEEHLKILSQGFLHWNKWKNTVDFSLDPWERKPKKPDLSGACLSQDDVFHRADVRVNNLGKYDFRKTDLSGTIIRGENLEGAKLSGADLSRADLGSSNLREADLFGANLSGASLSSVDLSGADLRRADLRNVEARKVQLIGARLQEAVLTRATLSSGDLRESWLNEVDLTGADLECARLDHAYLWRADLSGSDLRSATLGGAYLQWADLSGAILERTDLGGAYLAGADLSGARLTGADLERAVLVGTKLQDAELTDCRVYGIAAWDLVGVPKDQANLVITPKYEAAITVDDLKIAQFIYLLLHNEEIRDVIDTITSKVVLILGRFTNERKAVLDAIREELRKDQYDYVPVVFDFDKPASQTTRETVTTLAGMARFVIADLTDAKSVLLELEAIVPKRTSLPVRPILLASQQQPGMLDSLEPYPWFLPVHPYETAEGLIEALPEVIAPAEAKALEIRERMEPSF